MKKILFFSSVFLLQAVSSAETQEPENCLSQLKAPCLVHAEDGGHFSTGSRIKLSLGQHTIIEIRQFPTKKNPEFKVGLLSGQCIIENKDNIAVSINSVSVGLKDTYYAKKDAPNTAIYKSETMDLLKISRADDMDSIESHSDLNLKKISDFLSQFKDFKQQVQVALENYKNHEKNLDQNIERNIASDNKTSPTSQSKDVENRQNIDSGQDDKSSEIKKIKDTFFMRTFEQ